MPLDINSIVSVFDFKQPTDPDWRNAIIAGDAACATSGKRLWFPAGTYRCSDGIPDKKATWVGAGAPVLGTFPVVDDKRFLRSGQKDNIPGTVLLFTGSGTATATTQRSDRFSSFTYCVKTAPGIPSGIRGMAIVQDMDVYVGTTGSTLTSPTTDNRASYDVGYMIDMSFRCQHEDFVVFGYFSKAGIVVHTQTISNLDNPDYNSFHGGSTSGDYGLALIGDDMTTGGQAGLSGTNAVNFQLFSKDHHSRVSDPGSACLYIDGSVAGSNNLNGHYFTNCLVRTYCNSPIALDRCSHLQFVSSIFEMPGSQNTKQFCATQNTNDVVFVGCRWSCDPGLYLPSFAGAMGGQLTTIGGPFGGVIVSERASGSSQTYSVRLGGASGGTGDPAIQFLSGSPGTSTTGWSIRSVVASGEKLDIRWDNKSVASIATTGALTSGDLSASSITTTGSLAASSISTSGAASFKRITLPAAVPLTPTNDTISVSQAYHTINAPAVTEPITTILGGVDGELLYLRKVGSGNVTISKTTTGAAGGIFMPGSNAAGTNIVLTSVYDLVTLLKVGNVWIVQSFSDNY